MNIEFLLMDGKCSFILNKVKIYNFYDIDVLLLLFNSCTQVNVVNYINQKYCFVKFNQIFNELLE